MATLPPQILHATAKKQASPDSSTEHPLTGWRNALQGATPEVLVKLLVDIDAWTRTHPRSSEAWTLMGDTYLVVKQPYAAEKMFRKALKLDRKHARAREGLGLSMLATGQTDGAAKHLSIAHQIDPTNSEILVHLGLALMAAKDYKQARTRLEMAAYLNPGNAEARLNLGLIETHRGQSAAAAQQFEHAVQLKPELWAGHRNLALALHQMGELDRAIDHAKKLTQRTNTEGVDWILLADLQLDSGQPAQAESALQKATVLASSDPNLYLGLAKLHAAKGSYERAEGLLDTALAMQPDNPEVLLAKSHLHLLKHQFDTGWELHEARRHVVDNPIQRFRLPNWEGGPPPADGAVLVHAEQGLGDTIMFAHCLPDLLRAQHAVVVEVSTRLAPLFARSFPSATVVGRLPASSNVDWLDQITPPVSSQIPIGSLPRHFRQSLSDFPAHTGYLKADPEKVSHWKRVFHSAQRPVVGLAWRGGLVKTGKLLRSIPLETIAHHLKGIDAHWISLQYGDVEGEVHRAHSSGFNLEHQPERLLDQDEVAAMTCAMDAVITVCTTQAHLTGALGQRGMVLVPSNPNWRYGQEGEKMPWYPSLVLNRQRLGEKWDDVMVRAASWLSQPDGKRED